MRIKRQSVGSVDARSYIEKLRGNPLTFARLIESHRLTEEITQTELSRRVGISRQQLCDIEKGRKLVSAERAAKFAKVMGYPVEVFVAIALEDQLRRAGLRLRVNLEAA